MTTKIPKSLLTLIETSRSLKQLQQIHAKSIALSLSYKQFIITKLISSFLSPHSLHYAVSVFDQIDEPSIFMYNGMIRAYSNSDAPYKAISVYNQLRVRECVLGDKYTYPCVVKACSSLFAIDKGREVHGVIVKIGFDSDRFLSSSLLSLYSVCGEIETARRVFNEFTEKDVVFLNAMLMGYARKGMALHAFDVFKETMEAGELKPNEGTMLGLISACMVSKNLKLGKEIHGYLSKEVGFRMGVKLGAALIDMYVKCGRLEYARRVFDEMPQKNIVVWNSLIYGYSESESLSQAIELFREMHLSDVRPDKFTISSLLSACARAGAINQGSWVWKFAENEGIWDVFIGTSLVDMYAKCGSIELAREVFDQMDQRTVATWNAILSGYAANGQAEMTMELFKDMQKSGAGPDSITFLALLSACAHAGLVEKGKQLFNSMTKPYNIMPKVEHYGCMVDLLGRAGLLREARKLIERMAVKPNVVVWGALLSACSIHGDADTGEWAAQQILKLDAADGGTYVLLANLFAATRRFDGINAVREAMVKMGISKLPGCSMIEIADVVHEFVVADKGHARSEEIYSVLDELSRKLKMVGYVPDPAVHENCSEICPFVEIEG